MKLKATVLLMVLAYFAWSQNQLSMDQVESKKEVSMSEVAGDSSDGVYRYYVKGESSPYTGVLYSTFSNGNYNSWQEYVDGVGQGKWINYYENGNYKEIGNYEQNQVTGPIIKFHENGALSAVGTYRNWRVKVGQWHYFDANGELMKVEDYGSQGNTEEVKAFYQRGEISYAWYAQILQENGQSPE